MTPSSEKVSFPGSQGGLLAARLDHPAGTPIAYAVFAHCFTCSKDGLAATRISRTLAERGIAVLRFDFTGLGNSEGEFANSNFSSNVESQPLGLLCSLRPSQRSSAAADSSPRRAPTHARPTGH